MPVIFDPMRVEGRRSTIYPAEFAGPYDKRLKRALTGLLGLTQFGVNLTTIEPGGRSAERHWHQSEDEFVYVLAGELVLVTKDGEVVLKRGMAAGFPAGDRNGHHLLNRTTEPAHYLEVGTRANTDDVEYPDIDLKAEKRDGKYRFLHKDGTPYA